MIEVVFYGLLLFYDFVGKFVFIVVMFVLGFKGGEVMLLFYIGVMFGNVFG